MLYSQWCRQKIIAFVKLSKRQEDSLFLFSEKLFTRADRLFYRPTNNSASDVTAWVNKLKKKF